jgi:hypothetical protein
VEEEVVYEDLHALIMTDSKAEKKELIKNSTVFEKTCKEACRIYIWTVVESSVLDKPVLKYKNTGCDSILGIFRTLPRRTSSSNFGPAKQLRN